MEEMREVIDEIIQLRSKDLNDSNKGIVKCLIRKFNIEEYALIKEDYK
jgi:hypothetical protein